MAISPNLRWITILLKVCNYCGQESQLMFCWIPRESAKFLSGWARKRYPYLSPIVSFGACSSISIGPQWCGGCFFSCQSDSSSIMSVLSPYCLAPRYSSRSLRERFFFYRRLQQLIIRRLALGVHHNASHVQDKKCNPNYC